MAKVTLQRSIYNDKAIYVVNVTSCSKKYNNGKRCLFIIFYQQYYRMTYFKADNLLAPTKLAYREKFSIQTHDLSLKPTF